MIQQKKKKKKLIVIDSIKIWQKLVQFESERARKFGPVPMSDWVSLVLKSETQQKKEKKETFQSDLNIVDSRAVATQPQQQQQQQHPLSCPSVG